MPLSRRQLMTSIAALAAVGAGGSTLAGCAPQATTATTASAADWEATGPITYVTGKDTSGKLQELLDRWNADHADQQVTLIELPESADEQRTQFIQNAQVSSDAYTVLGLDVVWTAEFAANGWIVEIPAERFDTSPFLAATVDTATYFNRLYAIPFASNGQLLFYRRDLLEAAGISEPPTTFAEMVNAYEAVRATPAGANINCWSGQLFSYEGLTVNFSQMVNSSGGSLFDDAGKPQATSDAARTGLQTLVDGLSKGWIPQEVLTFKEEEGRTAFQQGRYLFHQNWPYVYELAMSTDGSSAISGRFGVAPILGVGSNPGRTTLGGLNLGISTYAKNKGTALAFIEFMTAAATQKEWALTTSQAPSVEAVYDDPEVIAKYAYTPTLKDALLQGRGRPKAVRYGDITLAIQQNVSGALRGSTGVDDALSGLQSALERLV